MKLKSIQSKFRVIADQLGSNSTLPTRPPPDEGPYAEHIGDSYFYVVSERGFEFERRETKSPDELLSWFVRALTFEIAGDWELNHRIPAQDSRRLLFKSHVELLRGINESWADQQQAYYDDVLMRHPFDDASEE